MVKTVAIGSMVLCHLLAGTPSGTSEQPGKITKVLGEVVDISKAPLYIEKVKDKEALAAEKDMLIVKGRMTGQQKDGVYQISSTACMLVRKETAQEEMDRKILRRKKTDVDLTKEKGKVLSEEEVEVPPPAEEVPPPAEEPPAPVIEQLPEPKVEKKEVKKEIKKESVKEEKKDDKKEKSVLDYIVN